MMRSNSILKPLTDDVKLPNEIFKKLTDETIQDILPYYWVSSYGRLYSEYSGRFLSLTPDKDGYLGTVICTKYGKRCTIRIHRLMMLVFYPIPNPHEMFINHIDGIKYHNELSNLEWVTPSENNLHAYRILQVNRHSNVSEEAVRKACQLMQDTSYGNAEIARILINDGISEKVVSDIRHKRTWNRISDQYTIREGNNRAMPPEFVNRICEYFQINPYNPLMQKKDYYKNALNYAGVIVLPETLDIACRIYARKSYVNISCNYNF